MNGVPWIPSIYPLYVSIYIYTSTMEPIYGYLNVLKNVLECRWRGWFDSNECNGSRGAGWFDTNESNCASPMKPSMKPRTWIPFGLRFHGRHGRGVAGEGSPGRSRAPAPHRRVAEEVWIECGSMGGRIGGRPRDDRKLLGTLWWTNILPWKITIFNGKIHYNWPFSIAMLVHQRVKRRRQKPLERSSE